VPVGERQWIFPMDAKVDALMADGTHRYWSTHCRHDDHEACSAGFVVGPIVSPDRRSRPPRPMEISIERQPAQCKKCAAPCVCPCHTPEAGS
jgi:hypothetical protein